MQDEIGNAFEKQYKEKFGANAGHLSGCQPYDGAHIWATAAALAGGSGEPGNEGAEPQSRRSHPQHDLSRRQRRHPLHSRMSRRPTPIQTRPRIRPLACRIIPADPGLHQADGPDRPGALRHGAVHDAALDQGVTVRRSSMTVRWRCRSFCLPQRQRIFRRAGGRQDLSFEVAAGEVLGIGGPNGAGKTTLFEVISGFSPASAGEILFDGRTITLLARRSRSAIAGIARTFQLNAGFDSLSVRDNVLVAAYFGRRNRVVRASPSIAPPARDAKRHSRSSGSPTLARCASPAACRARTQATDARRRARHRIRSSADGRARRRADPKEIDQ